MARADLYLGHFCLNAPPAERFEAAARAGFTGITLCWDEVRELREAAGGLADYRRLLTDAQLKRPFIEVLPLPTEAEVRSFSAIATDIAGTAAELGCEMVHAAALRQGASLPSFPALVAGAGALAEACQRVGLKCVIEFVPFLTAIPDLATAIRLQRAVGLGNLGVLVDSLHFFRSGAPWSELASLAPTDVFAIQVNDGPAQRPCESYGHECLSLRRLPGDGDFDLGRLVRTLAEVAPAVPLMAEVVNSELLALPALQAAQMIGGRMQALQRIRAVTIAGKGKNRHAQQG